MSVNSVNQFRYVQLYKGLLKFIFFFLQYKKPQELILSEKLILEEINKVKSSKDGEECKVQ